MGWGCFAFLYYTFHIKKKDFCFDFGSPGAKHVCLQLSISKECLVWVSTHRLPLKTPSGCQLDDVSQPVPYCSEAQTSPFCRADRSQSFARDGENKKGVGAYSIWVLSKSLKFHVSAPHILFSLIGEH